MVLWTWPHSHLAVSSMRHLCIFAPSVYSSNAVDGGPLATRTVKSERLGCRILDKFAGLLCMLNPTLVSTSLSR